MVHQKKRQALTCRVFIQATGLVYHPTQVGISSRTEIRPCISSRDSVRSPSLFLLTREAIRGARTSTPFRGASTMMGEILLCYRLRAERSKFPSSDGGRRDAFMQLFVNEKEVPTLVKALEILVAQDLDGETAEKLLSRIQTCIEKQCRTPKTK